MRGNQLDLSQKVVNMSLEQTNGKYIYIYIYNIYILYVYVSNQIQQNRCNQSMWCEAERFQYSVCVCALRSVVHG